MISIKPRISATTTCASWRKRSSILALALLAAMMLALTLEAGIGHAATFNVTNTRDSGPGSLRQAITNANANNNPATADAISFDIRSGCAAGSGVCTISTARATQLPDITEAVIINGYSQPGASANTLATGNNAELKIELSGAIAGRNGLTGITVTGPNSVVKGLIINRWSAVGINVEGAEASGNRIEGNYIGTDASGSQDLGNDRGVDIRDAPNNVVGGTSAAARNIIANSASSDGDSSGIRVFGLEASGNKIQGNYIGTDASGQEALGNGNGVVIDDAPDNAVGGASALARNVTSGNRLNGIQVFGSSSSGNTIQGNFIGTDASGRGNLGNGIDGVEIINAPNNTVGGTSPVASNIISYNVVSGVRVSDPRAVGNSILRNSIFDNRAIGIDLGDFFGEGVTPNDPRDPDTGPNNLQNYPIITSATTTGRQTTIRGTLNSNPNQPFGLRFFDSPTADPSGFGEGKTYLGQSNVSTNASGNATFSLTIDAPLRVGHVVSATATNRTTKDTSEFSRAVEVEDGTSPTVVSTNPTDGATGVPAAVNVSATFSEQMNASTINSDTFKLFRKVGTTNTKVAAVVSYNVAQKRATLNPNANLVPGGRYVAQVTTGAQDLSGNGLAQRKDFTFTVRR